ncbi:MerR family transcriptional regulator [Lentibacillus cibarius]|uniref:Helix-turn-helix domain-containing protein n=1 Tax=Lentibacillus cibarius TaxID=2583219 RepID=A0A5S3R670_9BACI|nr:hypothetical protein [Lentibacillus cibarius]RYG71265.1 hypothetical protein EU245_14715 [Lentibacillus lipolyticus]TMN18802.1 hypothetical protein FFL34_17775 [Lentibacillus cibarius]TMN18830.1 hypothetical protein FFL34_17940 [Lentibacillus cibarius]
MKTYTVETAFDLLKDYKITTHIESVRRWLREGKIKGTPPKSRKEGWLIQEEDLLHFIQSRLPDEIPVASPHTTTDVKGTDREAIRAEMWWELVRKNIFEDLLEVKKTQVRDAVNHMGLSKTFERDAWGIIQEHKRGYASPRIPYLLDAALFNGQRIMLDTTYENKDEQVVFAVLEYLRQKKTKAI